MTGGSQLPHPLLYMLPLASGLNISDKGTCSVCVCTALCIKMCVLECPPHLSLSELVVGVAPLTLRLLPNQLRVSRLQSVVSQRMSTLLHPFTLTLPYPTIIAHTQAPNSECLNVVCVCLVCVVYMSEGLLSED